MKQVIVLSFLFVTVLTSCHFADGERIRGNGVVKSELRAPGSFSGIEAGGAVDIYVKQDSAVSVKIETDENLLPYIETYVNGEMLVIRNKRGYNLKPTGKIKVYVSAKDIHHFNASGASDIISQNKFVTNENITIDLSGASTAELQLQAPKIDADLSGAGTITLLGQTKDLSVDGSGASNIRCFDMMAENTRVHISGAGDADVFASVTLSVSVSGAGSIRYKGNATVTKDISGAGSVKKVE